ncbi:MAG: hypothetical protein GF355_15620 [Candidatus Eisenbacteria bacterium]|nr:hypothetical protein [Candidatus Eisenbacteria bacterium]
MSPSGNVLRNEFTWSVSRQRLYEECPRAYYFRYYGSWEGWSSTAPPLARALYILKQLKSRQMWAGSLVHEAVEQLLQRLRAGDPCPTDAAPLAEETIANRMRPQFKESRDGAYLKNPKGAVGLVEHHYDQHVTADQWRTLADDVRRALETFVSRYAGPVAGLAQDDWLLLEDLESFAVDDVPVWVKCDLAYRARGGRIIIVDWKTGKRVPQPGSLQLGCYGLYAAERWNVDPSQVLVREINLTIGAEGSAGLARQDMETTRATISSGIRLLQSKLADVAENVAHPDAFPAAAGPRQCRRCPYLEACPEGLQAAPMTGAGKLKPLLAEIDIT